MFALSKNVRSTRKKFPFQLFGHVYKKCSPFQNCSQLKKIVLNLKSCPHFFKKITNSCFFSKSPIPFQNSSFCFFSFFCFFLFPFLRFLTYECGAPAIWAGPAKLLVCEMPTACRSERPF